MANTLPDVLIPAGSYVSAYTASGVTLGRPLVIQNKSSGFAYLQIQSAQPATSSTSGTILEPLEQAVVSGTIANLWIKGSGNFSIQENV